MASFPSKALVLMQLSMLLLMSSSVFAYEVELVSWPAHPPAIAPEPHHHHHHHHHHPPSHPPVHPPVNPPAHPPVKPPVHPPVKPPTKPPVHLPVKPPTKPPVYAPVKPPTKPPVKPPTKPPVHPPVKPPTKPPVHPPVKPPTKPPVYPPVKPPTKPPVYPPVKPPTKPPVYPPVKPPTKPPVHPPVKPPTKPPVHPPVPVRKLVAVQGVVFCKSCKYAGVDTLWGAKPLVGAVVRLRCHNTKYKPVVAEAKTDKNGYFLILPEKVTNAASHKCKVFLVKSPSMKCDVPTNFNYGFKGATLVPTNKPTPLGPNYALFNVGPFAYEPSKKIPCPR